MRGYLGLFSWGGLLTCFQLVCHSAVTGTMRMKPGVEWTNIQPVAAPAASRSAAARKKAKGVPQVLPQGPEWEQYSFNTPAAVSARAQEQAKLAELRLAAEVAHNVAVALGGIAGASGPSEERRAWLAVTPGMRATVAAVAARARARASGWRSAGSLVDVTDASGMVTHLSGLPLEEALCMLPSLQSALRDRLDGMAPQPAVSSGKDVTVDGDSVALMAGVAWLHALNGDLDIAYQLLTDATLLLPRRDGTQADLLLLTCYCAKLAQAKGALAEAQGHWTSVLAQADAIFGQATPNEVALDAMRALGSLAAALGETADMRRWWANVEDMRSGLERRSGEAPHLLAARMQAALGPVSKQRALRA